MTTNGDTLLRLARQTLEEHFGGAPVPRPLDEAWLWQKRAVFATLHKHGALRGCVGQLVASLPLFDAVREAVLSAAFRDHRFERVTADELPDLRIELSLLSPLERLEVHSEAEAISSLRAGVDGVVLSWRGHSGVFIPEMWKQLPDKREFLRHLRVKAGFPADTWPSSMTVERFTAEVWEEPTS